ncbi:hypothetical protein ACQ4PT_016505 [Festuca glaucescens]
MEDGDPSAVPSSPLGLVPPASEPFAPPRPRLVAAGAPAAADGDHAPAELEPRQAVIAESRRPRMEEGPPRRPLAVPASRASSAAKPDGRKKAAPPRAKKLELSDAAAHRPPHGSPPPPVPVLPACSVDSAVENAHDLFGTLPANNMIKRAERPGFCLIGSRVTVLVNRYITFCCPETIINMYKVSVTPETRSRCIKEALVEELVKISLGNKVIAFDGTHIYTITPFSFELEEEFVVSLNEGGSDGAPRVSYSITIHFAKSLKMQEIVEYYDGERSGVSQDTLHAINVVVRALSSRFACLTSFQLKYGNEENFMPTGGRWNMVNKKLIDGGKVERWACLNFSKVAALKVESFCTQLINMCNDMGMVFEGQPLTLPQSTKCMDIQSALKALDYHTSELFAHQGRHKRLQLLIVILPEEKGHYGTIKRICETQLGIVSQCCLPKHVKEHANAEYLKNVVLKINVKAGGRNAILQEGLPFLSGIPTIIFGADVSHPSPGVYSPSISAVVASMDWPEVATYRCVISAQLPKQEIITNLFQVTQDTNGCVKTASMIKELLLNFYQKNHRKPERIIFYRYGVSESQFSQVLLHEVDAIRKACMSLDEYYLPPITFVVVQKRHQTRLFPFVTTRDPEPKGILPGTVVDYGICDPWGFDFYLSSHASEGSCRPTHYTVLFDENRFTPGALQSITYNLCYTYARCTHSVSIVAPVYYAHLAASRGRSYQGNFGDGSSIRETTPSDELPEFLQVPKIDGNISVVMFYC